MTSQRPAPGSPPALGDLAGTGVADTALASTGLPDSERPAWPVRRLLPLLGLAGVLLIGFSSTVWWGPGLIGRTAWALPNDLWGTLIAANRLLHGNLAGLYTQPTGLITFPGGAIILMPVIALIDVLGMSLHVQGPGNEQPVTWLLAGPYETIISAIPLFAADAIAEHVGASKRKRVILAAASAIAVWNVSIRWGHPEDAVAVGLLLYAILDRANGKTTRSAWLTGAAVAVQPLVLLVIPVLLAVIEPRRIPGFLTRAAAPAVVLLTAAAVANWHATYKAIFQQPNWPTVDHPTPWLALATKLPSGAVAAGPVRLLAVAASLACGFAVWRQCRTARNGAPWDSGLLLTVLWWAALALALRSVFEPVMVSYYLWPVLAAALIAAITSWPRLLATSLIAVTLTFVSQSSWRGEWTWWGVMVLGLAVVLACSRPARAKERAPSPPAACRPATRK
jgi:hypothetical protein